MIEWNIKEISGVCTGYEDVMNKLKNYTKEQYMKLNDKEKEIWVDEILHIYRTKNIFPITYYDKCNIKKEIIKCIEKDIHWDGNILNVKNNQGSSLCRFLFPNLQSVECKGLKNNSPLDRFNSDEKLKKAIKFCLNHKTIKHPVVPSAIKDGIDLIGGNVATNFSPMKAKALYEKYCPENSVIYDYACGFGGRMLGALSSKKNYTYIGVEPCMETYMHLNELGLNVESVTNRKNSYQLMCMGSEDYKGEKNSIDFAFSSPPYFNLEKYSNEPTQCYNKFTDINVWLESYVRPTIENIYYMLKNNRYYAVNISDFKIGNKEVKYVEKWKEISNEIGFRYVENIPMKLQSRRGSGHNKNGLNKEEGIFIFEKITI